MAVLTAGQRIRLDRPNTPQVGDVYLYKAEVGAPVIRGFLIVNLSSATVLAQWQGGQPNSSAQYNAQIGAYEAVAQPTTNSDGAGAREIYVFSTSATAEFLLSLYDDPVSIFFKANPATVPTAAAVKLEDGATAGRYALVSAAGALLTSITGAVSSDVSDRAGRLLGVVASITSPVDISDRAGRLLGVIASITNAVTVASITAALPAGANLLGRTGPDNGALTDRSGTITTGGTRQQAAASNAARKFIEIGNPNANVGSGGESLWYSLVGNAAVNGQGSVELTPGGVARYDSQFIPTSAIDVVAATTGHKFYCVEA